MPTHQVHSLINEYRSITDTTEYITIYLPR